MYKSIQKNAAVVWRFIFLFIFSLSVLVINSCKKEKLPNADDTERPGSGTGEAVFSQQRVKTIGFKQFLDSTKNISSGNLTRLMMNCLDINKHVKLNSNTLQDSLVLFIDSIKLIERYNHQTYTIPVKQSHIYDLSFRNLIFDVYKGEVTAFLATYTPDNLYLTNYAHGVHGKFTGKAKLELYDLNNNSAGLQIQSTDSKKLNTVQVCQYVDLYLGSEIHMCSCNEHWPWQIDQCTCPDYGGTLPWMKDYYVTIDVCYEETFGGGGGGGGTPPSPSSPGDGGGGGTPPTTPPDYDPCPPVNATANGLKIQKVADESPCNTPNEPQQPQISTAQFKTRIVINNIISELEINYQVLFNLTAEQRDQLADFIYNDDASNISQNISQLDSYVPNSFDEDPPIIAAFKAYIRKLFYIQSPASADEARDIVNTMNQMGTYGQYILQTHERLRLVFGFVPGYVALDDLIQGDQLGFAANASLDIFGGELIKYLTGPILRAGSRYFIRIAEMAAKYPNIVNYFKSIGVHELTITKGAASDKIIIVGERMAARVEPSIDKFNQIFHSEIKPFTPTQEAEIEFAQMKAQYGTLTDAQLKSTKMYQQNVDWIQQKISEGYTIIDIGIDQSNPIRSVFYTMERSFIYK